MLSNEITLEQLREIDRPLFIDLRSPSEWNEGNIPGSINIPLLDDAERTEVGIVYKNVNEKSARDLGLSIVSPKLPTIVKQIEGLAEKYSVVLYCWRGGLRSKSVTTVLGLMGLNVYRLKGGYRSYRNQIIRGMSLLTFKVPFIVLHGMTGVGKTLIINELQKQGYPTLNLEDFAGHRGSIFGAIGLQNVNSQKQFDALLLERMQAIGETPYYIIEAESKRIGRVTLPDSILEAKQKGTHIVIEASLETRVERLYHEYVNDDNIDQLLQDIAIPIQALKKKLLPGSVEVLEQAIQERNILKIIHLLMTEYYDPRYNYKLCQYAGNLIKVDATNLEHAVNKIIEHMSSKVVSPL